MCRRPRRSTRRGRTCSRGYSTAGLAGQPAPLAGDRPSPAPPAARRRAELRRLPRQAGGSATRSPAHCGPPTRCSPCSTRASTASTSTPCPSPHMSCSSSATRAGGGVAGCVPVYYGLQLFAQAAPPGSRLLRLAGLGGGSSVLSAWATRGADRIDRVVADQQGSVARRDGDAAPARGHAGRRDARADAGPERAFPLARDARWAHLWPDDDDRSAGPGDHPGAVAQRPRQLHGHRSRRQRGTGHPPSLTGRAVVSLARPDTPRRAAS